MPEKTQEEIQNPPQNDNGKQTPIAVETTTAPQQSSHQNSNNPTNIQPDTPKKSKIASLYGPINLLLILVLAGGFFYLLTEMKDKQQAQGNEINKSDMREIELNKQYNLFQSQLGAMQEQMVVFSKDMAGKDGHFTQTLADFTQSHTAKMHHIKNELANDIARLKRRLNKTRGDWLIADAEYLLSIANQRLHLADDVKTARMALKAADQRLRESGDAAMYKIRQRIVQEIAQLATVNTIDVVGIYSKIQLLQDNSANLTVLLPYADKPLSALNSSNPHKNPDKQTHTNSTSATHTETEYGILNGVVQSLKGYITIRHSDLPVTQILSKETAIFIKQQLNVKLELAKIALVQRNVHLYKASLADAKQWLRHHFIINPHTMRLLEELDNLRTIQIHNEPPDVSQSLKMLKDIVKLRLETDKATTDTSDIPSTEQTIVAQ